MLAFVAMRSWISCFSATVSGVLERMRERICAFFASTFPAFSSGVSCTSTVTLGGGGGGASVEPLSEVPPPVPFLPKTQNPRRMRTMSVTTTYITFFFSGSICLVLPYTEHSRFRRKRSRLSLSPPVLRKEREEGRYK